MRKWVSGLFCVCLLMLGLTVSASATEIMDSGYCGDPSVNEGRNVTWTLDSDGTLTISGTGKMADYSNSYYSSGSVVVITPWCEKRDAIKTVVVQNGATSIGDLAFYNYGKLSSVVISDGVTSIGKGSFFGCNGLSGVSIPNSVLSIGESSFCNCSGLASVSMGNHVTSIGKSSFHSCTKLTSVTIPNSVATIGESAFQSCSGLLSVSIGSGVTSIGDGAFASCSSLASVTIPGNVTSIGDSAFDRNGLKTVILSDGVTSIGARAFYYCSGLTSVTIPDSVTSIGSDAFAGCGALASVTVPAGTAIGTGAFDFCSSLATVTIGGTGPMNFGAYSSPFYNSGVKTVVIQSGVTSIEGSAFSGCSALTRITIPSSVTSVGGFYGCNGLTSAGPIGSGSSYEFGWTTAIPVYAFYGCSGLVSVTIPDGVTSIGNYAFGNCEELTSVTVPDSVASISWDAFTGCSSLKSAGPIGSGSGYEFGWTTAIPAYAFYSCSGLTSVTIPGSISSIASQAFDGCAELTSAGPIGSGCDLEFGWTTAIPANAFSGFSSLTSVTFPKGMTSIGSCGLDSCADLTEVTIPSSVTSVEWGAFGNYAELKDVYYLSTKTRWDKIDIKSENDSLLKATIHYKEYKPPAARTTYSTASGTSVPKVGMKTVQFDAGADLYKNGKTRTTMNITWNWNLFGSSAIGYSKDLATAAIILSGNAYTKDLVKDTLENKLGFSNTKQENYEIGAQNADLEQWISNTVGYSIASTTQIIDGKRANVIAIVLRGTPGTPFVSREWKSNLREMENGFLLATNDVISGLNSYIADPKNGVDTSLPVKYFITGHSRGAAVANRLGPVLSDAEGKQNVFVYTFACPTTSNDPNRQNYNNIKNFINVRDAVPALPGWLTGKVDGYNRFGLECSFDKSDAGAFDSWLSELTDGSTSSDVDNPIKEHCIAVYAAYVLSADLFHSTHRYKTKVISVKCPVDVAVYDSYDRLLGTITDNVPDDSLIANGVYVTVDGDEKYIYTTSGFDLRLELTGTDTGTMTYSVEEIDASTGETMSSRTFSDVNLTDGKTMTSAVVSDIAAVETQLFIETGGEITAEVAANGDETDVVMLSFDTDLGEPLRDMSVPKGGKASSLSKAKMDGYTFDGWYTDAGLTSAFDLESTINSAMTLYAKFEPLYDVYGYFTNIDYDGSKLTAKLNYAYNTTGAQLVVALYQDGQMIAVQSQGTASGASASTVSMSVSGLYGIYQLKSFLLDTSGYFTPVSGSACVSFYAN